MLEKLKHPIAILLLKFGLLYLGWFLFYHVWLRSEMTTGPECDQYEEQTSSLDNWIIIKTTATANFILTGLGQDVFYDGERTIGLKGSGGLWMGDSCNAISLIALFAGMIIAFSGIWWQKIIFIVTGGLSIWFLNVLRVVFLALLNAQSEALSEFNHTYTFTILMYAYIIFLWYWWIQKFADQKAVNHAPKD